MRKIITALFVIVGILFLIVVSIQSLSEQETVDEQISLATLVATPENFIEFAENGHIDDLPLVDNVDLYQYDDPGSLLYIYVTVQKGNPSDNTDYSWQEVNDFTKWFFLNLEHIEVGKAEAIVQIGDENGPVPGQLGFGEVVPNATIQIRGASTSTADQKSYKIEFRDRAGTWMGQSTLALNKHPYDIIRIKNKLAYDLIKEIPDMVTLRTQFVRLFVKDETSDPPGESYVDYGLFTQVEQPNKAFLRNHKLDPEGHLYKTTFFEFYRYEEALQPVTSSIYDEDLFNGVLEIKGNQDHRKLIQMLEDVNNWAIPIETVFDTHFNADNYFTWMAFNILVGNVDTQTQNFYLYSPKNSNTWYFMPWDYDGSFARQERQALGHQEYNLYAHGVSNYWGAVVHNRVLRVEEYRAQLDEKIHELRKILTPEKIKSMAALYRETTEEIIFQLPDIQYLPGGIEEYNLQYELLPSEIQANYDLYLQSLEKPMPYFQGTPKIEGDKIKFNWDESYDFDAEDISYHFQLSTDWDFNEIVYETTLVNKLELSIDMIPAGTYFWRVLATNTSGYSQFPFDFYKDAEGWRHSGMKYLQITSDGQVLEQ
jgi:spore coat protein H